MPTGFFTQEELLSRQLSAHKGFHFRRPICDGCHRRATVLTTVCTPSKRRFYNGHPLPTKLKFCRRCALTESAARDRFVEANNRVKAKAETPS